MARSSRLSVCLATVTRNSSYNDCERSISRQRTTPWTDGIGPLSIIRAMAWRCSSLSFGGWPGDLPSSKPSGPRALNRCGPSSSSQNPVTASRQNLPEANTVMANLHRSPHMNQSSADLGIVKESQFLRLGIRYLISSAPVRPPLQQPDKAARGGRPGFSSLH